MQKTDRPPDRGLTKDITGKKAQLAQEVKETKAEVQNQIEEQERQLLERMLNEAIQIVNEIEKMKKITPEVQEKIAAFQGYYQSKLRQLKGEWKNWEELHKLNSILANMAKGVNQRIEEGKEAATQALNKLKTNLQKTPPKGEEAPTFPPLQGAP